MILTIKQVYAPTTTIKQVYASTTTIKQVYAPTTTCSEEEMNKFYETRSQV